MLSSSLESELGYKDYQKIKNFINKINELKIKKKIPLIDQHDKKLCMEVNLVEITYQNFKKPIDDLTKLFAKLRKDKKFLKKDHY